MKNKLILVPIILTLLGASIGLLIGWSNIKPVSRNLTIKARQYSYEPEKIEVNQGDTLHLTLVSLDVFHGFYLEGYDVDAEIQANVKAIKVRHPSEGFNWKDTSEIYLIVNKTGKYRYRCSHTCGTMHPFMQGEMIVKPNNNLNAGIGGVIGFAIGMLIMIYRKVKKSGGDSNV
jgi:heme/copper-type cytochrome/quinol oxidase subunit 2